MVPRKQAGHMTCTRPRAECQILLAMRASSTHDPKPSLGSIQFSCQWPWIVSCSVNEVTDRPIRSVVTSLRCTRMAPWVGCTAIHIRRRAFISALLGGAVVARPLAARAHQPAKVHRIAVVSAAVPVTEIAETSKIRFYRMLGAVTFRSAARAQQLGRQIVGYLGPTSEH